MEGEKILPPVPTITESLRPSDEIDAFCAKAALEIDKRNGSPEGIDVEAMIAYAYSLVIEPPDNAEDCMEDRIDNLSSRHYYAKAIYDQQPTEAEVCQLKPTERAVLLLVFGQTYDAVRNHYDSCLKKREQEDIDPKLTGLENDKLRLEGCISSLGYKPVAVAKELKRRCSDKFESLYFKKENGKYYEGDDPEIGRHILFPEDIYDLVRNPGKYAIGSERGLFLPTHGPWREKMEEAIEKYEQRENPGAFLENAKGLASALLRSIPIELKTKKGVVLYEADVGRFLVDIKRFGMNLPRVDVTSKAFERLVDFRRLLYYIVREGTCFGQEEDPDEIEIATVIYRYMEILDGIGEKKYGKRW